MDISIRRTLCFEATPEQTYERVTALSSLTSFVGYGPVPGIARATVEGGASIREGSVLRIENTDGSTHSERIEVLQPPDCYRMAIYGFDSPFRFMVKSAIEQFDFAADAGRTRVERLFCFTLTSPLVAPVAWPMLNLIFARALDRNYDHLRPIVEAADRGPLRSRACGS